MYLFLIYHTSHNTIYLFHFSDITSSLFFKLKFFFGGGARKAENILNENPRKNSGNS